MKINNYISLRSAAALCCAAFASFLTSTSYADIKHVNIFHVLGIDRWADDSKGQDKARMRIFCRIRAPFFETS